jgi:lipopolysaccharide export LptBFGC system permease protein LptF
MLFISSIFSISPKRNQANLVFKLTGGILIGFGAFFMDQIVRAIGTSGRIPIFIANITIPVVTIMLCITILLYQEDG